MKTITQAACLLSLVVLGTSNAARAQERASAAETCLAANRGISLRVALPRAAARL
jgi:hypothetical protein